MSNIFKYINKEMRKRRERKEQLSRPEIYKMPPVWFKRNELIAQRPGGRAFLFQSWIPEHTDKLIAQVSEAGDVEISDLDMFEGQNNKIRRNEIMRFAERHGELYQRMMMHKLVPYREKAAGLIVTLDWIPVMRHLVSAASQLGIPTILLPHESVFAKESMYYVHPRTGANVPLCDLVLAWGDTQERIFVERGYPAERIVKVGAPKFDYLISANKTGSKKAIAALGLDPEKPVITFSAQPLDSQYDSAVARTAQNSAILDLVTVARQRGAQVLIRMPPSKDSILGNEFYTLATPGSGIAIDDANLYILTAEETISASDVVVSINSTMLLEAALAGKVAISAKYVEFDQVWDGLRIPVARNAKQLNGAISTALENPSEITAAYDIGWAASAFGIGQFDGNAARRAADILVRIGNGSFSVAQGFAAQNPDLMKAHRLDLAS